MGNRNFDKKFKKSNGLHDRERREFLTAEAANNKRNPKSRTHEQLIEFGKELYCMFPGDDNLGNIFVMLVKLLFGNGKNVNEDRIKDFFDRYKVCDLVPPRVILQQIAVDDQLQRLIVDGYNWAKDNPDYRLVYFGRELYYRAGDNGYTYENFFYDIDNNIFPSNSKPNKNAYAEFAAQFTGYSFFPDYNVFVRIVKRTKIRNYIINGYNWAMRHPDIKEKYLKKMPVRRRLPIEC